MHGASAHGAVVFRKKLARAQFLAFHAFPAKLPACTVAMEACVISHFWGREIAKLGHAVRLVAPIYVKPFVKRTKNDTADAESIAEAASRPTMRFVAVKTEEQQAGSMVFRARDLLVRQHRQLINALRGHLAEYGVVAAQGPAHLKLLLATIDAPASTLPTTVRDFARLYLDQISQCTEKLTALEKTIRAETASNEATARLQTMPGVGPISAMASEAFAPPMQEFRLGRDFAAWLGLVPRQKSAGGRQILGKTSKMGQRDRRPLLIGAMAWSARHHPRGRGWHAWSSESRAWWSRSRWRTKMACGIWAMLTKQENYRDPMAAALRRPPLGPRGCEEIHER